jgi:hypothetical protein
VTTVPTPGGLSTVSVPSIVGRRPRRPTSPIPFGPRLTSRDPSGCHRHHRDAVASLWPVDDLATALLMTPVYEELFAAPHSLPEALRRAQLWLRDLTADGARAFLDAHPALAAERRRRGDKITNGGDMAPGAKRRATVRPSRLLGALHSSRRVMTADEQVIRPASRCRR